MGRPFGFLKDHHGCLSWTHEQNFNTICFPILRFIPSLLERYLGTKVSYTILLKDVTCLQKRKSPMDLQGRAQWPTDMARGGEKALSHGCHRPGTQDIGTEMNTGDTEEQTQDTVNTPLSKSQASRILKNNKKANTESQNSGSQNPKAYYHLISFERILS